MQTPVGDTCYSDDVDPVDCFSPFHEFGTRLRTSVYASKQFTSSYACCQKHARDTLCTTYSIILARGTRCSDGRYSCPSV